MSDQERTFTEYMIENSLNKLSKFDLIDLEIMWKAAYKKGMQFVLPERRQLGTGSDIDVYNGGFNSCLDLIEQRKREGES